MAIGKTLLLEQLKADIINGNICPELREQATQLVLGDGNPNADIVFIGEAPGKKEDEQGLPFIGASGRFLDQMLDAAGMVRSEVYITSIVKYRPPNNRDPTTAEKAEFWPYLVKQLSIIEPKVVITLGRHAMECFIPGVKISEQRGQAVTVILGDREFLVIPLYHPAAALYNGSLRQTLVYDFISAKALADNVLV
ncbi:MAG: uracil-DNA glycosylase [Candidatus Saccharimonadales bacterium]